MLVHGSPYRTVWHDPADPVAVQIIDQRQLPFRFACMRLPDVAAVAEAIRDMAVRGAGCIGAAAAWGMWLAAREAVASGDAAVAELERLAAALVATRPTAVNLAWAVDRQLRVIRAAPGPQDWVAAAFQEAQDIANEDAVACAAIGGHGLALIRQIAEARPGRPVNVLTHCNAGWLAFVDHGSATAPLYAAHEAGIPIHVWVDETRPRNQGARLTAWELAAAGVPHTLIADNAGGHLMQQGLVDMVITGADRVTRCGDVANKIGTYLKALAARDCGVPFYVTLPSSTLDWSLDDGRDIPIENRDAAELLYMEGTAEDGSLAQIRICGAGTTAANPAFDVTPARLITGLITERGICVPTREDIARLHSIPPF